MALPDFLFPTFWEKSIRCLMSWWNLPWLCCSGWSKSLGQWCFIQAEVLDCVDYVITIAKAHQDFELDTQNKKKNILWISWVFDLKFFGLCTQNHLCQRRVGLLPLIPACHLQIEPWGISISREARNVILQSLEQTHSILWQKWFQTKDQFLPSSLTLSLKTGNSHKLLRLVSNQELSPKK